MENQQSLDVGEQRSYRPESPKNLFCRAKQNPDKFWTDRLPAIRANFARSGFTNNPGLASVTVVIPCHNETIGEKAGHLEGCLAGVSQIQIPRGVNIRVAVIGHNNDPKDKSAARVADLKGKVAYYQYDTPLRGFTYPLQMAAYLPGIGRSRFLGIIDGDTVVGSGWLEAHLRTMADPNIKASAGPRLYLGADGKEIPYGTIKVAGERLIYAFPGTNRRVKLVSGNSFFRTGDFIQVIDMQKGLIVTDGDIQREIGRVALTQMALAYSDGKKFNVKPDELAPLIWQKFRTVFLGRTRINDHIRYLLELTRYFPDFGRRVERVVLSQDKEKCLGQLLGLKKEFEDETKAQFSRDITAFRQKYP